MPKIKNIGCLEKIVGDWVWRWLLKCMKGSAGPKVRRLQKEYVHGQLNGNIKQFLLSKVLNLHMYQVDVATKCTFIELMSDRSTFSIDVSSGGYMYIEELFHLYRSLVSSLPINLCRFGVVCKVQPGNDQKYIKEVNSMFYRLLGQMKHLRWVTLQGVGEYEIMTHLAKTCHYLEYLDVSDSWLVDDECVASLLLCQPEDIATLSVEDTAHYLGPTNWCVRYLFHLGISGTDVTLKSIALVFNVVSRIRSFGGHIPQGSITNVLEMMQPEEGSVKFYLKQLCDDKISEDQASLLSNICPHLTSVSTSRFSLSALCHLENLTSLTIDCDYQCLVEDLYDYLIQHGTSLTKLVLTNSINTKLDICWLTYATPMLRQIEARIFYSNEGSVTDWPCLEIANVMVDSSKCMYEFITHSTELTKLTIQFEGEPYAETANCIDDQLIIAIANKGGFSKVQQIKIGHCGLGLTGADTLLLYCSELHQLSTLSLWSSLKQTEYEELKTLCSNGIWDVQLFYYDEYT